MENVVLYKPIVADGASKAKPVVRDVDTNPAVLPSCPSSLMKNSAAWDISEVMRPAALRYERDWRCRCPEVL